MESSHRLPRDQHRYDSLGWHVEGSAQHQTTSFDGPEHTCMPTSKAIASKLDSEMEKASSFFQIIEENVEFLSLKTKN